VRNLHLISIWRRPNAALPILEKSRCNQSVFSVLERLFPSLLQHSIGLNQEERATLQLQPAWELLVDFYQTAFPMALIYYGLRTTSDAWLTALTIRWSRLPLAHGDIFFLYTDL
jgi:hypothetical protein